ncbi:aldehyde dehydrogenase [Rhizobium sp. A37_96]
MNRDLRVCHMLIDGETCNAGDGGRFTSVNPATEEPWATFPEATAEDVDRAVKAAHAAFRDGEWSKTSATERGSWLHRIAREIERSIDELAEAETIDTGKLLKETRWQARNLVGIYDYYAGLADKIEGSLPPTGPGAPLSLVTLEPLGVVAAIIPWNSQLQLAAYKIAPALAAGNTIVVKASEAAPAAIVAFGDVVRRAGLPKGVFNIVTGGGRPCGETLVSHPLVRRVSFTGGVETARKIIPATATNIANMSLELGGKSPVIVFDDADLDSAVNGVISAIFAASGQSCAAGSRLLIQAGVYDTLLERLRGRAADIRLGDPRDAATDMGPLATGAQRDRIERLLQDSIDQGARLIHGGRRSSNEKKGYYFEPTIVACDHQDLPIVRNELFGPVLSVLRFETEEEAIRLARDSEFAFAGGVFTSDFAKAYRIAKAVPAGRFWINTYRVTSYMMPFGGSGASGYGREAGIEAVRDYMQSKSIFVEVSGRPVADPFVMRS